MRIGQDYPPVEFDLFGFHLIEPNALTGDIFIAIIAFVFAFKTYKLSQDSRFFSNWALFYIFVGISFIGGGLGHSFFNIGG